MMEQKNGFNSNVIFERMTTATNYQVLKKIGARRGDLAYSEATELISDIIKYQNQLWSQGVPIPPIKELNLKYFPEIDKAEIMLLTSWVGDDVSVVLLSLDQTGNIAVIEWIIKEMCRISLLACAKRTESGELLVGFDAKANNFTVKIDNSGERTVFYVDQYPPRYWKNGNPIIEWIPLKSNLGNELGRFKYFNWRGVFLTLTSQLSVILPKFKIKIESIAMHEFKKSINKSEFEEFLNQYNDSPWIAFRNCLQKNNMDSVKRIITNCVSEKVCGVRYSVYTLREILLELAMQSLVSKEELRIVFSELHFEDEEFFSGRWKETEEKLCNLTERFFPSTN